MTCQSVARQHCLWHSGQQWSRKHTDDLRVLSYIQNNRRGEQKDREACTGLPLTLFLPHSLSLVSPFTVVRAFQHFLFSQGWIVGDNLRLPIGWLHTKSGPGKRAFVTAATQIQRLAFLSPRPRRGTHTMPHHQRKKRKEKEWHIEKGKPYWPPLLHSTWLAQILKLVAQKATDRYIKKAKSVWVSTSVRIWIGNLYKMKVQTASN